MALSNDRSKNVTVFYLILASLLVYSQSTTCNEYLATGEGNCKLGWEKYGGKCYKIFSNDRDDVFDKNFEDAQSFCKDQNPVSGSLAIIHEYRQIDFLVSYLGKPGIQASVYIGLHRDNSLQKFKWVDGSEMDVVNFVPGEPSNGLNEKCVQLQGYELSAGMWNDDGCDNKRGFICQTDQDPSLPESEPESNCIGCPDGSVKYRESCYSVSEERKTWNEAENSCQSIGGHLVSMVDNYEWSFVNLLTNKVPNKYWIGLRAKLSHLNLFKHKGRHQLEWSDNRPVRHLYWDHKQPKYSNTEEIQCIEKTESETWVVADCNEKKPFICIKHANEVPEKAKVDGFCPIKNSKDLIDVGGEYCYLVKQGKVSNWYDARSSCQEQGGDLAFFKEQSELDLLGPYLTREDDYNKLYYVGIRSKDYNDYKSVDGQSFDSDMWHEEEPNNLDTEKCVTVYAQSMRYFNSACFIYHHYICQIPKVVSINTDDADEDGSGDVSQEDGLERETTLTDFSDILINVPGEEPRKAIFIDISGDLPESPDNKIERIVEFDMKTMYVTDSSVEQSNALNNILK